jgi:hypothetical protein
VARYLRAWCVAKLFLSLTSFLIHLEGNGGKGEEVDILQMSPFAGFGVEGETKGDHRGRGENVKRSVFFESVLPCVSASLFGCL